jgi:ribose transport system substrate-binding protein
MKKAGGAMRFCAVLFLALAVAITGGCGGSSGLGGGAVKDDFGRKSVIGYSFPVDAGKYTVLDIRTDNKDEARALSNAEDTLIKHPDVACMVGLWAYNPPQILSAVRKADKLGKVKIVGFDENESTLQGIAEGDIHGTIVQQPFLFGYKSVEYLSAMARGEEVTVPANGMIYVDHTVIKSDNVEEFRTKVENMYAGKGESPPHDRDDYNIDKPVKIAFLTNSIDPFWVLAQRGCELAEPKFNAECEVYMPPRGLVEEQKRYIEDQITKKCQGLAISPIDPKNQTQMINEACEAMPVICQDSDAPASNRRFYLGTSNYLAGRAAGKLVKEAIPDGGKVMIFVGKMEVLNAQERSKGVIDELMDKPLPAEFAEAGAEESAE